MNCITFFLDYNQKMQTIAHTALIALKIIKGAAAAENIHNEGANRLVQSTFNDWIH